MSKTAHFFYLAVMSLITIAVTAYLFYVGMDFYFLPLEERFYHPDYDYYKASGLMGHGLGIVGTLLIAIGVVLYITAKKYGYLDRFIRLKYLLEFHIFLCTLGPIMILFHTTFKFGGIVSIAFWSMVAVVLSGVVGRYIYLQIPRTISGRELSLEEVGRLQSEEDSQSEVEGLDEAAQRFIADLKRDKARLESRIKRLQRMQQLFKYWHVAHRPFAVIMLVIVSVHVVVTLALGYTWIW
jgi:hypothetical protein